MIEVTVYKDGAVQPLPDGRAMTEVFSLLRLPGLRVFGSSERFEVQDGAGRVVVFEVTR